ncbi:MAG: tRNA 2-selenouridine(34) synthase MnmH [Bacillota bacterium]
MDKITYKDSLNKNSVIYVDVRTSKEYNESTIPGAINLPILNNKERKTVGTIYNNKSPGAAKMKGVEFISPKIPELVKKIKELRQEYNYVIIFCSRGNLRSKSIVTFADLAGLKAFQLKDGYKAYRHFILDELENYKLQNKFLVIHGNTGVGKTDLLYKLKNKGINIIDLEGLANHRGSAFGGIGLQKPRNQKMFDSLLWEKLESITDENIIAVEAENRRIGMSNLPQFFVNKMEKGIHILIESSMEARINRIYNEYTDSFQENQEKFIQKTLNSIESVKKHLIRDMGKEKYNNLKRLVKNQELKSVIKILLKHYYDPLYNHKQKMQKNYSLKINSDNINYIKNEIIKFISKI